MDAARNRGLAFQTATEASEFATHGVRARFDGRDVVVGKPKFVAESAAGVVETALASGELAIYVGVAGEFAGALVMSDPIRREARRTLTELESMGVTRTVMLTGDALATAEHIADEAGLTDVRAECLPPDKVEAVRSLPLRPVMMVGDGVNDAPVLAVADVGIAMGARGSTAAGESADVVIILDDLSKAASAVRIGQRTVKVALQSIWIGIGLSVALMVGGGGRLCPGHRRGPVPGTRGPGHDPQCAARAQRRQEGRRDRGPAHRGPGANARRRHYRAGGCFSASAIRGTVLR